MIKAISSVIIALAFVACANKAPVVLSPSKVECQSKSYLSSISISPLPSSDGILPMDFMNSWINKGLQAACLEEQHAKFKESASRDFNITYEVLLDSKTKEGVFKDTQKRVISIAFQIEAKLKGGEKTASYTQNSNIKYEINAKQIAGIGQKGDIDLKDMEGLIQNAISSMSLRILASSAQNFSDSILLKQDQNNAESK